MVCEIVLVIANVGTAVLLFPVLRRHHEAAALGYVTARVLECALILVGMLSLLAVLTLRRTSTALGDGAGGGDGGDGGDGTAYEVAAQALVAVHDWTFLLGPGFVVGIGNGFLLGYALYRSRLVPRRMALLGLVGGPLMSLSGIAVLFGLYGQSSLWSGLATLPEIAWEASLGLYLTIAGFRRQPGRVVSGRHLLSRG